MTRKNKVYSPEFKIQVIETKLKENLGFSETARRFNMYYKVNGYDYPDHKRIIYWERIYLEEGPEGLYKERRGQKHREKGYQQKKLDPKIEEDLIAKCQRLEMENEFLKKLNALVSERELKEKKSHK